MQCPVLYHPRCLCENFDMSLPKYGPRGGPLLEAEDEELEGPEEGPGAVGKVAGRCISMGNS